jgi:putative peptidoglycan lipid II flippase
VTAGVAVMALALVPTMLALGYRPRPQFGHPALVSTARLAGPMVVLVAASVGFQFYGAYLATGFKALAALNYAFTIFSLPYGIFVVAIATALMPELSEKYSRRDADGYRDTFSFGLRTMIFVVIPSAVGMISLSRPIVGLLYEHLNFDAKDTEAVSRLLVVYGAGLLGYSVYFYLVRAFYSRQNTKTPAVLNVVIFLLYATLAYGLSRTWGVTGVVLALAVAYTVLAILSLAAMRRETGRLDGRRLLGSVLRIIVAGTAMYAVARVGTLLLGVGSDFTTRLLVLVAVGGVSLAVYLGVAFLLGTEELKSVATLLKRRSAGKSAG